MAPRFFRGFFFMVLPFLESLGAFTMDWISSELIRRARSGLVIMERGTLKPFLDSDSFSVVPRGEEDAGGG